MSDQPDPNGQGPGREPDLSEEETLDRRSVDLEDLPTAAQPPSTRPRALGVGEWRPDPGQDFGPYRLIRLLGKGGFGQVWEAESRDTGRRLALKVLTAAPTADPEEIERFEREGRLAASLSHPHCVYVFSAEQVEGFPVITMELMPGGTLQDRLRQRGPLPYREAVDYALQIAEGLEAAEGVGVIHRDVKPSNCFLDASGAVRVGDFGLSKTLDTDSHLTVTGSFLGTPAYSSPEQVKGRDVDSRSDLYSLGATLYALLTGRPPFSGGGGTQVLARILSEPPDPFSAAEAAVPTGLRKVVLRLLAKEKGRRYPSYAALRTALLPYSSRGLAAGQLGRRLLAILADLLMLHVALAAVAGAQVLFHPRLSNYVIQMVWLVAYFGVLEGLGGRSPGKRLLGLRVVTSEGAPLPFAAAALRAAVFTSALSLPAMLLIAYLSGPAFQELAARSPYLVMLVTELAPIALLLSTVRKRNGYAALHDLATRTRVMAVWATALRPHSERTSGEPRQGVSDPRDFGPYREIQPIWEREGESLLVARDEQLRRDVWVHTYREGAKVPPIDQLAAGRPGRLQWLQGSHEGTDRWDAFEAPSGRSLLERVRSSGGLPWAEVRHVLHDVSAELSARQQEARPGSGPRLSRVWVSPNGGAKLLDFSATGDEGPDADAPAPDWRGFVSRVVLFALEGKLDPGLSRPPRLPLPEHARPLVQSLFGIGAPPASPDELRRELDQVLHKPAAISWRMRLGPIALTALLPAFLAGMNSLMIFGSSGAPTASRTLVQCLSAQDKLERIADLAERRETERAIRILQAHSYGTLQSLASDETQGLERSTALGLLDKLAAEDRRAFESALAEHPSPTVEELVTARRRVDALSPPLRPSSLVPKLVLLVLLPLAAAALVLAPILRGPPLFALFGIVVQTTRGERASRLRCLLRSALTWAPFVLFRFWQPWPILWVVLPATVVAGVGLALAQPDRGLPDLVARTRLVAR